MRRFLLLILIIPLVSGCSISFKTTSTGFDGGIFKTTNRGENWTQKVLIPTTSGKPRSIASQNTRSLIADPSDVNAIYYGSYDNGMFFSYDGGNGWQHAENLGKFTINAIAVDPKSKCIIYAASTNKVFKTTDCSRTWQPIYFDNDLTVKITDIAIDHYNTTNLYIATSRGEVIKSSNRGESWKTLNRFDDEVKKILISPHDSRVIFVGTEKEGVHRSYNSGVTWENLSENIKEFDKKLSFRDIVIPESEKGTIFLAMGYGLLKSVNNGDSWEAIELITPEKGATINSFVVSPKSTKEMYYVTNTTFYRSLDGGQNWTTRKMPSSRAGWKLLIDQENPNIIYMGVREIKN